METVSQPLALSEWTYRARSACQSFACRTFHADRYEFEEALAWLYEALPTADPRYPQQAAALRELLMIGVDRAAAALHRHYHRLVSKRCAGSSSVETAMAAWADNSDDPRVPLCQWARAYLAAFDATHPWPPAGCAAAILRQRYNDPPTLDELANAVNASRRALSRGFQRLYGMSPGDYLVRVRLRRFIEEMRGGSNATRSAQAAGYFSYHNLRDALRQRTGLAPSDIRRLTDTEVFDLQHSALDVGAAGHRLVQAGSH
jgi:AraC-like DNA-binding protein